MGFRPSEEGFELKRGVFYNFCKEAEYYVVSGGGVHRNLRKIFFDQRLELLPNRVLRKFESCMMGKTGVWFLRKNLVLFWPPDMQKTQEFPGFFGLVSFLLYPSGKAEKKMPQNIEPGRRPVYNRIGSRNKQNRRTRRWQRTSMPERRPKRT